MRKHGAARGKALCQVEVPAIVRETVRPYFVAVAASASRSAPAPPLAAAAVATVDAVPADIRGPAAATMAMVPSMVAAAMAVAIAPLMS